MLINLLILGIMCGAWGYLWSLFAGDLIPKWINLNLRKPLGECMICTSAWWAMLVFFPLYLWVEEKSMWYMLLCFVVGGTSSATAVIINYIAQQSIKSKYDYEKAKENELEKLINNNPLKPNNNNDI